VDNVSWPLAISDLWDRSQRRFLQCGRMAGLFPVGWGIGPPPLVNHLAANCAARSRCSGSRGRRSRHLAAVEKRDGSVKHFIAEDAVHSRLAWAIGVPGLRRPTIVSHSYSRRQNGFASAWDR